MNISKTSSKKRFSDGLQEWKFNPYSTQGVRETTKESLGIFARLNQVLLSAIANKDVDMYLPGRTNAQEQALSSGVSDFVGQGYELTTKQEIDTLKEDAYNKGKEDSSIWQQLSDGIITHLDVETNQDTIWSYIVRVVAWLSNPDNLKAVALILAIYGIYVILK